MPDTKHNYLDVIYFRDEYGENQYPQKLCNHLTWNYIKPNPYEKLTLLDIGSGKGNHLIGFHRCGFHVKGIDIRPECLAALDKFDIRQCDLEKDKIPFNDNNFDIVFSKSMIEHVANADHLFQEAYRILRPGGKIIIMTPDWLSQRDFFWDDYTHVRAWTRKGLQNCMIMRGFKKVECETFRQLPLLWKYPWLKFFYDLVAMLPNSWKWKDKEEKRHRPLIRFAKEKMLFAIGTK